MKGFDGWVAAFGLGLLLSIHGFATERFLFNPTPSMFEGQRVMRGPLARVLNGVQFVACAGGLVWALRRRPRPH